MRLTVGEQRSEHCKFYTYPTVRKAVQKYANANGLTFSEACQEMVIRSLHKEGML